LLMVLAWASPVLLAAGFGLYVIWLSSSTDKASVAAEEAVRAHPELLTRSFTEVLDRFGVMVPQSDPIGAKTYQESLEALKQIYPDLEPDTAQELERAHQSFSARNYAEAESVYRELIELYPNAGALHHGLALCLMHQQKYEEAEAVLRKYIGLTPSDAVGHINLGWIMIQLDRNSEAVELFEKSIRLDSSQILSYLSLSRALSNLGRFEEAKRALDPVVAAGSRLPERLMSVVAMSLGAACIKEDSLTEASNYFYRATLLDSTNGFAYHNLGVAFGRLGDRPRCIEAFADAVRLAPEQTHWRYLLGRAYHADGQFEKAYLELHAALQTDPDYFADSFFTGNR